MLAITLARHDFREFDQLVTLYTLEQGKIEVVARGIKKNIAKNAPALEPFSLIDIELAPGRELTYLIKAHAIKSFSAIRTHLTNMLVGAAALQLVGRLVKVGEKDAALFAVLAHFLQFLNSAKMVSALVFEAFTLQLLAVLGFVPVLDQCVLCSTKRRSAARFVFAVNHGGLICSNCRNLDVNETLLPLSAAALEVLQTLIRGNWSAIHLLQVEVKTQKMVERLVKNFTLYHTNQTLPLSHIAKVLAV